MSFMIKSGLVITNDPSRRIIKDGVIVVEGDSIVAVSKSSDIKQKYSVDKTIDAKGKVVIPGLINTHTHMFQVLTHARVADVIASAFSDPKVDKNMFLWYLLKKAQFPLSEALKKEDVAAAAFLACVEMIRGGMTCVVDNHYGPTDKGTILKLADAIEKVGMRGVIARGIAPKEKPKLASKVMIPEHLFQYSSEEEIRITEECIREVNYKSDLVKVWPAPLSEMYISPDFYVKAYELAKKHDVGVHTHMEEGTADPKLYRDEYGKGPVEILYDLGVLFPKFQMVHGTWLSDREIELIGKTGATVVHNPVCNVIVFSPGVAPVPSIAEKGGNVALGTDGVLHNMFDVLKMTIALQRVKHIDPLAMSAEKVFEFATLGGARAVGLEKHIGSIEPGKKADMAIINLKKPNLTPVSREPSSSGMINHLILYAVSTDVDTTIINGKIVMEDGVIKTVDEDIVIERAQEAADGFAQKFAEVDMP